MMKIDQVVVFFQLMVSLQEPPFSKKILLCGRREKNYDVFALRRKTSVLTDRIRENCSKAPLRIYVVLSSVNSF